jgi:hypothetical protein
MMTPNQSKIIKDVSTPLKAEVKPKDVKNISKQVTQAIVEKKAAEDPSWFERNKKGLRDAGIILSGALASFGEGIKGGDQVAAGERMMANLDATAKADEQEILDDPNSAQSKEAQSQFKQMFGNRVKMPQNMSASQFTKMLPVYERIYQRMSAGTKQPELQKPILTEKQISRFDTAKRMKQATNELASEIENSNPFTRFFGSDAKRKGLADDVTSYKAYLQEQGQAGEGQIKAGRELLTNPDTFQWGSTKADDIKQQGDKFYQAEIDKLRAQGFQAKEINGKRYLTNPATGEYMEIE